MHVEEQYALRFEALPTQFSPNEKVAEKLAAGFRRQGIKCSVSLESISLYDEGDRIEVEVQGEKKTGTFRLGPNGFTYLDFSPERFAIPNFPRYVGGVTFPDYKPRYIPQPA